MNDNFRQLVFGFVLLVLGAGAEEMLPKCLGVGFPFLLTTVQALASGGGLPTAFVLALMAGALEDALSSLPFLASVSYFIIVVLLSRSIGFPRLLTLLTYPCYQLWLALWTSGSDVGIFSRLLLSLPLGILTSIVVGSAISWLRRKGAVDERD